MKTTVLILFFFVLLTPDPASCLDVPENIKPEIIKAMKDGNSLYEAYLKGPKIDDEIMKDKSKITDFCELKYNAYIANGSRYFIAEPPTSGQLVFGKHFRVFEDNIIKSTKSCFISSIEQKNVVGAYVTHLLSDCPSEFHVFISLKYKKPIYVVKTIGIWKVLNGKIECIDAKDKNGS